MTPASIYARFSPRPDAATSESIETQLERCRAYCVATGYTVAGEHQDREMSGARADNRPGLQAAIEQACATKGVLVVYSLSRLARNTRDAIALSERLSRCGAQLASLHERLDTASAMGRFFFTIMAALAELERAQIVERTSDAMRRHQASGRRMSDRVPYGWRRQAKNDALLEPDPLELATIAKAQELHAAGHGWREIGRLLRLAGFRPREGEVWHHRTVQRMVGRTGVA